MKLHRCRFTSVHRSHPCNKVQRALDEAGIDYEVVVQPAWPRSRRSEIKRLTGEVWLPVVQFEDGSFYRDESGDMAATIRARQLGTRGVRPPGEPV